MHQRYMRNAGQGCASPTRILIHEDAFDEFLALTRQVFANTRVGDPWHPETVVGPVISAQHRDSVEGFVARALESGGEIVAGGGRPEEPHGWYVNPALIAGVAPDSEIAQEEDLRPRGRGDDLSRPR